MKQATVLLLFLVVFPAFPKSATAETVIDIDGSIGEWDASDAQCMLSYTDSAGSDFVDVARICVTDSASSDGYFYLLIEFVEDNPNNNINRIWLRNANVFLNVDTDSDGVMDLQLDFINDPSGDVYGIINMPYLETRIDYDLVDPDGDREFSFFVETSWRGGSDDRVPYDDGTTVDYSVDPETGSPRSVRMLAQTATFVDNGVEIVWVTASERANAGFHVYRFERQTKRWIRLTDQLVPGLGDAPFGKRYTFIDAQGLPGDEYQIRDFEFTGKKRWNGAFRARSPGAFIDSYIPAMVPWMDKPFDLKARLGRLFASAHPRRVAGQRANAFLFQVDAVGLHRLSNTQLRDANLRSRFTQLSVGNASVPVMRDREGLLFFGAPTVDRYADYDVVVAKASRRRPAMVRQRRIGRARCDTYANSVTYAQTFENDNNYYVATPTEDPFVWTMILGSNPATLPFHLTDLVAGEATVNVALFGFAERSDGDDHIASFLLNGSPLGEWRWNGKGEEIATFQVPDGVLQPENVLEIVMSPERPTDMLSVDRVEVTYPRRLVLDDGQILFNATAGSCVNVLVNATDVVILDVTDSGAPVQLLGGVSDGRSLQFRVPKFRGQQPLRRILVASRVAAFSPVPERPMTEHRMMRWQASHAEYVVVTHPLFLEAATRLAEYHSAKASSVRSMVVTTDEIFDRYNGGRPHPDAIRQFLMETTSSGAAGPKYVVLLGSATVDSNDVMGIGDSDFVPTFYYRTNLNGYEAASDATFVNGLPQVALGRLAVRSVVEANGVVAKLIAWYDAGAPALGKGLYIADRESADERSFVADMNAQIDASGPYAAQAERFLLDDAGATSEALNMLLSSGADFVNYHGHAYVSGWSSPEVANLAFADNLQNAHLFFVMSWSCFDGMFSGPWDASLAWQFVANPQGGAYGALAGTSLADPAFVEYFSVLVTEELASGADTIGAAVRSARLQLSTNLSRGAEDTLFTYNLLADPATPNPWR